nr:MAG TPA: hypothetical protein [Caudoviricetes sp.]
MSIKSLSKSLNKIKNKGLTLRGQCYILNIVK